MNTSNLMLGVKYWLINAVKVKCAYEPSCMKKVVLKSAFVSIVKRNKTFQ